MFYEWAITLLFVLVMYLWLELKAATLEAARLRAKVSQLERAIGPLTAERERLVVASNSTVDYRKIVPPEVRA